MRTVSLRPAAAGAAPYAAALRLVTAASAALYLAAAVLHLGVRVPLLITTIGFPQPIPEASVAESIIGGVLAIAALALIVRGPASRGLVWGAYVFALLGTLLGLAIVLLSGLGGPNLGVHVVMLAGLRAGFSLLLTQRGRRPLDGATYGKPA